MAAPIGSRSGDKVIAHIRFALLFESIRRRNYNNLFTFTALNRKGAYDETDADNDNRSRLYLRRIG